MRQHRVNIVVAIDRGDDASECFDVSSLVPHLTQPIRPESSNDGRSLGKRATLRAEFPSNIGPASAALSPLLPY
jgi:hypothetical protein